MADELTFAKKETFIEFCNRIKPYKLKWKCSIHVNIITDELLMAAKDSGCNIFVIGVESADDRILKSMHKNVTVEQIENALNSASKLGIVSCSNLIFGDVEETMETVWNSINWRFAYPHIDMFLVNAYPGTHLYKIACERGIIKDRVRFLKEGCPYVNVSKLTDDEYNVLPVLLDIYGPVHQKLRLKDMLVNPHGDYTVDITGRCPQCSNCVSFERYFSLIDIALRSCTVCGADVILNPIEACSYERMNKNVESLLIDGSSAAIWAVTAINFHYLLKSMPVLKAENVRFINSNEIVVPHNGKVVKTLEDKKVYPPDIILSEKISKIIVPNSLKVYKEIKAQLTDVFPHVSHIVHITELI
jgi:hypothetical protein